MGEMADPGLRGFLVGGSFASYCLGILLVYAFGASFNWDVVAFCAIVAPLLALGALCSIPESPAWLVGRKKIEQARKALLWLRGGDAEQVRRICGKTHFRAPSQRTGDEPHYTVINNNRDI